MKLTEKQRKIVDFIKAKGEAKTFEINEILKGYYYHNHEHYVREIISRLVKSNVLVRKEKAVYILRNIEIENKDKSQINLF